MEPDTVISSMIVGAKVTGVLVDSEKTIILFDNGAVLEGEVGWLLSWEGARA